MDAKTRQKYAKKFSFRVGRGVIKDIKIIVLTILNIIIMEKMMIDFWNWRNH